MVVNLLANPWIAKNMSPEDYAISGYYTSYSSLISPIIIFYMIHYYIKEYFRRNEEERQRLMAIIAKATIWFSGCISILCFIALYIYINFFNSSFSLPVSPYLALMVFALPLTGLLNLQLAQYRITKKAKAYFILSVFNGILNIFLTICFVVFFKWGAYGKLLGTLICNLIVFSIMLIAFKKYLSRETSFSDFKTIFNFCLPLALGAMLGYFMNGFSTTYLESIGNTTEYGIYVVGASIGMYLTVFGTAIRSTFQPDMFETTIKKQWGRFFKFCMMQLILISFISITFILFAPHIISILTAGRYNASTPYAQIVAISTITSSIYFMVDNFTIATNHSKLYLYTSILGSISVTVLTITVVNKYSFYGGAWMSVLSYLIFAIINLLLLFFVRKHKQSRY